MSLINEALQRARQESRRREALAKGLPLPPPPGQGQHRSWLVAAVIAMALALVVSLVTIARLATSAPTGTATTAEERSGEVDIRPEANASDGSGSIGASVEPTGSATPTPGSREATVSLQNPTVDVEQRRQGSDGRLSDSASPTSQSPSDPEAPPEPAINEVVASGAPNPKSKELTVPPTEGVSLSPRYSPPDSEAPPGDGLAQPRIFVEKATLSSGEILELGGIAWSETGPYALLDERVVGLGERVMGYMVTRIAPQEVELEGNDGAILIRLK